jgi:hypothetical protein
MDDSLDRLFFLQPAGDTQRLYEALRAVIVDGGRQKEVAARFGYHPDAFRQQVHQFRTRCAANQPPPFSPPGRVVGRRERPRPRRPHNHRQSATAAS